MWLAMWLTMWLVGWDKMDAFATDMISTIVGTGSPYLSGDEGVATLATLHNPTGVTVTSTGSLYIADTYNNRIRFVSTFGIITTIAGSGATGKLFGTFSGDGGAATSATLNNPSALALDLSGNAYIADTYNHRIRVVLTSGIIYTFAGSGATGSTSGSFSGDSGNATSATLNSPSTVGLDSSGNVYIADTDNNRIRKIDVLNGIITTIAGTGATAYSSSNIATSATLNAPYGVTLDSFDNIYIVDSGHNRVRVVKNGTITTLAGSALPGFSGDGGPAMSSQLTKPSTMQVDALGNLYICDMANQRIRFVNISSSIITTVVGSGSTTDGSYSGDEGAATSATLHSPHGVAVDSSGNIYIADTSNQRIRKVTIFTPSQAPISIPTDIPTPRPTETSRPTTYLPPTLEVDIITTIVGTGTAGYSGDDGPATAAKLYAAFGFAINRNNSNMYIADYNNDVIRLVNDSSGEITTFGGTHGDYIPASGDGGPATAAAFDPIAVAVDSGGNVYISDHDNQRIRKIAISTGIISTYAGNGGTSFVDNAAATLCSLNNPTDIAFDAYDNLFIADENSNRIRKVIAQTMYMTTVAGSASTMTYFGDGGQATSAALYQPMGVTVGPSSNLYIADTSNQVVRKVTYGIITTIAGTGQTASGVLHDGSKSTLGEYNGDNIPATSASLNRPFSTYLDNSVLYIADSYNNRIRMVDLTTGLISTVAGTGATSYNGDSIAATSANLNTPSLVALDNNGHMIIADSFNNRIRKLTPMPTAPTVCPKGSFNNTETRTCESCPRNYYSDNVGSITCKSCPAYYLTPSVGATSADDCFDPYINFVLGFFAFLFVMGMICIYMPTSRFLLLGLSQFYKYTDGKLVVCKNKINKRLDRDISELSDQYFEVSENNARTGIYIFELGNKFVFVLKSVVAVTFLTIINCIGALIIVLFGSMIIWRDYGGEIGLLYGDIMLHQVRKLDYLVEQISTPFVHFFSHLSSLSVDLDPINVHCEGPKSIILFAIYLFIVGTIVMVIVSDLNVVFNCIYLVLHEKRLRCFNFKVLKIFKLFPSWLCLTVMNLFLASRPIIWLSLAFVGCIRYYKLINFYPFYSDFDKICSDVHGGTLFDSGLAALCTILVFILIIPGIYCLADVFVPFYHEELVKPPNKDAASTSSDIPNVDIEDPSNPCVVRFCWPLRDTLSLIEMPEFKDYKYYANGLVPHWDSQAKWQYIMGRLAIDKNILRALHWYVKFIQSSSMNLDVFRRLKVLCGLPLHHGSNDNKSSSRSQSENHFKGYYEAFYTYKLPHFFALSSAVCKELGATTNPYTLYYYMWVFLAYSGLGHLLTRTGRYYWSRVADKYWIFLRVCLGIWSSREYKCYNILGDKYANELNLKSETMGFSKDVSFDPNSLMWSLISIRIVLLLLLPKFSVFCIFVINTAHVPLFTTEEGDYNIFINSPLGNKDSQDTAIDSTTCGDTRINNFSLKFNPLHPFKVEKVKEKKISSYLVDYYQDYKYPPYFKYIIFAYELVTKCRLVNWLYGCVLTTLSIGLLFNTKTPVWAYSGWVIIFPICFMRSLWVVTHFAIRHNFIQQSNGAKQLFGENNGDDTINPIGVYMTDTAGGNSSHNSTYNCSDSSSYHRVPLDQFHAPGILEDGDGSSSRVISAKLPKGKYYAIKLYKIKDEGQYKHLLDTMSRNIEFIKEIREKIKEEAKAFVNRPHALCEGREDFQKRMFGDNRSYPISLGLVMDFEEGGSLAYNLAEGNLENDKPGKNTTYKLGFLADIAKGLRDLHDIDYAHGDIKPANIILHLKRTPSITFIDFDHSVCIKKKEKNEAVVMPPSSVLKGTLRYTAPELVDETIAYDDSRSLNDITLSLRNATKEADMYAFGMLCWEVLMLKDEALTWKSFLQHKPYSNRPFNEFELLGMYKQLVIDKDEPPRPDPTKPPLSELPNIKRMITKCWQLHPNDRLDAEDCFTILHREYEIRRKKKYDIFLSHPWVDKKVVRHIKEFICKLGYSVWYDENDLDGYLEATMKEGIANSKVVVACINQKFQERKNCMFELGYASGIKKPIVAIFMEKEPFKWANKEVKDCCKMVGKMFLDIGDVCSKDWPPYDPKNSSEYEADEGLEKELARALKREGLKTELEKHIIVEQLNSLGLGFSGGSRGNDNKNKK